MCGWLGCCRNPYRDLTLIVSHTEMEGNPDPNANLTLTFIVIRVAMEVISSSKEGRRGGQGYEC